MTMESIIYVTIAFLIASLIYTIVILVYPIINPTIISYPWMMDDDEKKISTTKTKHSGRWWSLTKSEKETTVVLAGSFNPPHLGHLALLSYLSSRYGKVIVVIGMNPNKQYLVSPLERADLVKRMLENTSAAKNVRIEVISGYIWRKVKPMGGQIFIRGIRSWEKDGIDERKLQIQNTWGPIALGPLWWPLRTIFIEAKPQYNHISSTLIRNIINNNGTTATPTKATEEQINRTDNNCVELKSIHDELSTLVPECLVNDVIKLYSRK